MSKLATQAELIQAGYPFGRSGDGRPKGDPETEWQRSNPDVVVYRPRGDLHWHGDNEHFLVLVAPGEKELLAFWTQSSCEGQGDNHIVLSRSGDGVNWSEPQFIAGTQKGSNDPQASWGVPIVSAKGRIYLVYTKEEELFDNSRQGSGSMGCLYSDDNGSTWIDGGTIPMPRTRYDHVDAKVPKNWIAWQLPIRDANGKHLLGYTVDTSRVHLAPDLPWWHGENRCYFMRFENLDQNPLPQEMEITWLPDDEDGLSVPNKNRPQQSAASEPACALLPDGRLFCIMRTMTGYIWYSVSDDHGHHWRTPAVLRYQDGGEKVAHPLSPCPLYSLGDGRFLLLFHNNPGEKDGHTMFQQTWDVNPLNYVRNPLYGAIGEYKPNGDQPIWFTPGQPILDTDGIPVGPKGTAEIGTYSSFTDWGGQKTLWYPDRKFYLLGKNF